MSLYKLKGTSGSVINQSFPFGDSIVLGSSADCDVQLDEPGVSSRHAEIRLLDGQSLQLKDLGSKSGTLLNGEPVKLKGMCCHQDHAGVGVAIPDSLQEYRLLRLKEMGCNAYRTAHNPPTPELLDACDRLGMLVINENRYFSSSPEHLGQLENLIRRDRNHPCVILWSIANEEMRAHIMPEGVRLARTLHNEVRKLDPTRPTTMAIAPYTWFENRVTPLEPDSREIK